MKEKWHLISKYRRCFDNIYHDIALKFNLSVSTFDILYVLYNFKRPIIQKEICDEIGINKHTINSAVKNMINDGLIVMDESKKISLTDKGKDICNKTIKKISKIEKDIWDSIDENELNHILELLDKSINSLKERFDEEL